MAQLNDIEIRQIATTVVRDTLGKQNFTSVTSSTAIDPEGEEALRITIVIPDKGVDAIKGEAALKTLVQMQDRLTKAGEERFPIIEYATAKELKESGRS
jgi:hypothetical protein